MITSGVSFGRMNSTPPMAEKSEVSGVAGVPCSARMKSSPLRTMNMPSGPDRPLFRRSAVLV